MAILLDSELRQLLDSPRLPFIARKIDAVLADEARRRQGFYAQISEGDKAEFINGQIIFHSQSSFATMPPVVIYTDCLAHLSRLMILAMSATKRS